MNAAPRPSPCRRPLGQVGGSRDRAHRALTMGAERRFYRFCRLGKENSSTAFQTGNGVLYELQGFCCITS
jgi:hypothetical protein